MGLSRGRFTLGLGVGGRADDHAAAGVDLRGRGRRLDEQLVRMRELWDGGRPGPARPGPALASPGGPELLFGAFRPAALARVARFGDGLLCAAPPSWAGDLFRAVERGWAEHGRRGRPRLVAQVNVALGPDDVVDAARRAMGAYYGFTGSADRMPAGLLTTPERVRDAVRAYADLGADEVVLYCWATDVAQVDRMADLVS